MVVPWLFWSALSRGIDLFISQSVSSSVETINNGGHNNGGEERNNFLGVFPITRPEETTAKGCTRSFPPRCKRSMTMDKAEEKRSNDSKERKTSQRSTAEQRTHTAGKAFTKSFQKPFSAPDRTPSHDEEIKEENSFQGRKLCNLTCLLATEDLTCNIY